MRIVSDSGHGDSFGRRSNKSFSHASPTSAGPRRSSAGGCPRSWLRYRSLALSHPVAGLAASVCAGGRVRARRTMRIVGLDRILPSGATANSVRTELSLDDSTGRAAGWLAASSARDSSPGPSNDAHRQRLTGFRSGCAPMRHSVTRARRPRGPSEVHPRVARDPC
jgi:hypothetical protein